MLFITINEDYFPTKFDNYIAKHEKPEHITFFSNLPFHMDSFVHG